MSVSTSIQAVTDRIAERSLISSRLPRPMGASAQIVGGVRAMCDSVTQGTAQMDCPCSDATSSAIAPSQDAAIYLGVCDKNVRGLVIKALWHGPRTFARFRFMVSSADRSASVLG